MDELVNLVSSKTGISTDISRQAVTIVVGFLKDKLPPPIAAQVDTVLSGQGVGDMANQATSALGDQNAGGMADKAKGMLGGLFGHKDQ